MTRRGQVCAFIVAAVFAAALVGAAIEFNGDHTRHNDFVTLYAGGRIIQQGKGARLYDLDLQKAVERRYTTVPGLFDHTPAEALLFAPFASLSYQGAFFLWLCVNLLILGGIIFLLRGWIRLLSTWDLLLVATVAAIPILSTLDQGQDSLLVLLLFACVFRLFEAERKFTAGALLAAGLIKPELVLPFALLAAIRLGWRHCGRFVAGFAAGAAGFLGVSIAAAGPSTTLGFPSFLVQVSRGALAGYVPYPDIMPNLRGLGYALFSTCCTRKLGIDVAVIVVSVGILVAAAILGIKTKLESREAFALDLIATLLVSWYLGVHDFSLIFLPAVLLLRPPFRTSAERGVLEAGFGGIALLLVWATWWQDTRSLPGPFAFATLGVVWLLGYYAIAGIWLKGSV